MTPGKVILLGSGMERRGKLKSVSGAWSRLTVEAQCRALSRSGVRIEPGTTHLEGMAEVVSGMGMVLEAVG